MPGDTGSRTPTAPAPRSPDTGVCSITPSELVAYEGNAINRLVLLEQRVAELEAKLVQANQLSDISSQIGWTDFGTYMGVSGWQQTEYGSLILPPGVTLSSLGITPQNVGGSGPLQVAVINSAGELVMGIGTDGTMSGTFGGGSSISAYADVGWHSNVFSSILNGVSIGVNTRGAGLGSITLTGMAAGIYYAEGHVTQYVLDGDGSTGAIINGFLTLGIPADKTAAADTSGIVTTLGSARETAALGTLFSVTSTSTIIALGWEANVLDGSAVFQNPYEFALTVIGFS